MKKLYLIIYMLWMGAAARAALSVPEAYTRSVDSLAMYIDSRCSGDREKVEAVYSWITHHLSYNLYTTFTSRHEAYSEERELSRTLRTREGVCRQFALLFARLSERMCIPAFVVSGYTRSAGGGIMPEPHDWAAALIDGRWYFYDPTFGMGYVKDYKFIRRPLMDFCHVAPERMVQTHMPYDPIWQLLDHPLTYDEFDCGARQGATTAVCHYNDSIRLHLRQSRLQRLTASHRRALHNGKGNRLTLYYLQLTEANIKIFRKQQVIDAHNAAMKYQNLACDLYDRFIAYKKAGFTPERSEPEVRAMLRKAEEAAGKAAQIHRSATDIPAEYLSAMKGLGSSIGAISKGVTLQKQFLDRYYLASRGERRRLLQ